MQSGVACRAVRIPTWVVGLVAAGVVAGCGAADDEAPRPLYSARTPLWKQLPDRPPGPRPQPVRGRARSFAVERVAGGFHMPVQVVARAGEPDRLYVVERGGLIRVVENGRVLPRPWADLRARVRADGERGLLSLVFSRDGRRSYVLYSDRRGDSRVVELPRRTLLRVRQPYENHKGGTLLVDERDRLVAGLGDGGSAFDPQQRGQDPRQSLGKLLRREADGEWGVVATGLRNPWRMSFDRAGGRLWLGDVGQDRVEEIDAFWLPEPGVPVPNLGWAAYEGDLPLGRKHLAAGGRLTWPVASYLHRGGHCSVTGGYVYRGRAVPALRGRYVFGDFCRGTLWSVAARGADDPALLDMRREAARLPGLTSFGEDEAGDLYATTADGGLWRLANSDSNGRGLVRIP